MKAWVDEGSIHMLMADGKTVSFPVKLNVVLSQAKEQELSNVELIANGTGLHWPDLDEDLSVLGILEGRFGKNQDAKVEK